MIPPFGLNFKLNFAFCLGGIKMGVALAIALILWFISISVAVVLIPKLFLNKCDEYNARFIALEIAVESLRGENDDT